MPMTERNLYIISAAYPYGKGEEFMEKELAELSKYFSNIHLFPLYAEGEKRKIPGNIHLNLSLTKVNRKISTNDFASGFLLALSILTSEFFHVNRKWAILKNMREFMNSVIQAKKNSSEFIKHITPAEENYFYSVWMNDGALILSILKKYRKIDKYFFRLHGYDLFDERRKDNYMPFRYFNFKHVGKIFVLSDAGYDYTVSKTTYKHKVIRNYSGLYDKGTNPFNPENVFTIVSCSRVIPLKRVDRIIEILSLLDFKVRWVHFGGGEDLETCRQKASKLPHNITSELKGHVSNEVIIDFYKTNPVNLFVHLSASEGLGMAIVEAQSFGIPALAINTGGVNEVVNGFTGILVEEESSNESIADKIKKFHKGPMNAEVFRHGVRQHWESKFEAVANYKFFSEEIMTITSEKKK